MAEDVATITVGIPRIISGRLTQRRPPDCSAAQMSLPFTVALAVVIAARRGQSTALTVNDYLMAMEDPEVRRLASTADCQIDDEVEALTTARGVPCRLTLRTRDGRKLSRLTMAPQESREHPLAGKRRHDLVASALTECAGKAIDEAEDLIASAEAVEQLDDVSALVARL